MLVFDHRNLYAGTVKGKIISKSKQDIKYAGCPPFKLVNIHGTLVIKLFSENDLISLKGGQTTYVGLNWKEIMGRSQELS